MQVKASSTTKHARPHKLSIFRASSLHVITLGTDSREKKKKECDKKTRRSLLPPLSPTLQRLPRALLPDHQPSQSFKRIHAPLLAVPGGGDVVDGGGEEEADGLVAIAGQDRSAKYRRKASKGLVRTFIEEGRADVVSDLARVKNEQEFLNVSRLW